MSIHPEVAMTFHSEPQMSAKCQPCGDRVKSEDYQSL